MAKISTKPLKPITEYAMAIIAKREHSSTELRRKLTAKGYEKSDIAATLGDFISKNYLDDQRYAQARARSRAQNSKWGAGRIRQELAMNGIDKTTSAETLETLSEGHDWLATATKLLQRRFPKPLPETTRETLKDIQKEKARRLNFLLRRGFSMTQSIQALGLSQEEALDLSVDNSD